MSEKNNRMLQERKTFKDTQNSQMQLLSLVEAKIRENSPLTQMEKNTFYSLIANAVLTQGEISCMVPIKGHGIFCMGNLIEFGLRLSDQYTNSISVGVYGKLPVTIDIKELWLSFRSYLVHVYPSALKDAVRMSAEARTGSDSEEYVV